MKKLSSSQAAWALLTEGVTSARLEAHGLRHLYNRIHKMIERSKHKDVIYQMAGDVILDAPERLSRLEADLDRTSYALAKMGEDFFKSRVPFLERSQVDESLEGSSFVSQQHKSSAGRLANRYLSALNRDVQDMVGVKTYTSESSQKGLPSRTNLPVDNAEAYGQRAPRKFPKRIPQPALQKPSNVPVGGEDGAHAAGMSIELDPDRPLSERSRSLAVPGDQYGHPVLEQGTSFRQRRPGVYASEFGEVQARPKVRTVEHQHKTRGQEKLKSKRYERKRRMKRKIYNRKYQRKYKSVLKRYHKNYAKNPRIHRRRVAINVAARYMEAGENLGLVSFPAEVEFLAPGIQGVALGVDLDSVDVVWLDLRSGETERTPLEDFMEDLTLLGDQDHEVFFGFLDEIFGVEDGGDTDKQADGAPIIGPIRHAPAHRQHRQTGQDKVKAKLYYRKHRNKAKIQSKRRYKKLKRNPRFKKLMQVRRTQQYRSRAKRINASFYREEFPPTNQNKFPDYEGIPESETPGKVPWKGQPVTYEGGSAMVIPYDTPTIINNKVAVTLQEIERGMDPTLRDKAKGLEVVGVGTSGNAHRFRVEGSKPYQVEVEVSGKDLKVNCSCPAWQWQGPEYWASQEGYLAGTPRGSATRPAVKDPAGKNRLCKHLVAVLNKMEI